MPATDLIEFLQAENRLLKDRLRRKRIQFTDAERALLARKAKVAGRKTLLELDGRFSRYSAALAPTADRREVEFRVPARSGMLRDSRSRVRDFCATFREKNGEQ